MKPTNTEIVAWWGAILASVVFIWDIIKWRRNAPRLRLIVRPNTFYPDSEQIPISDDGKGNKQASVKPSIHIEVVNIGMVPTTITAISAKRSMEKGHSMQSGSTFQPHFGKSLPCMIGTNDIWSCRVDQKTIMNLPGNAPIEIEVSVSHKEKPLIAVIPEA